MDLDLLVEAAAVHGQLAAGANPAVVATRTTHARLVTVAARGHRQGRNSTCWTKAEDAFLRENLGWLSETDIARRLGRTPLAVQIRWKRELRLPGPSCDPRIITAEQIAIGLGMDGKSVHKLIARGLLPGRRLPWNNRICRVVDRVTLLRWITNPMHWVYFKPERVGQPLYRRIPKRKYDAAFWQKAAALVQRRRAMWQDEWWSIGQVAAWHGVDHRLVNNAIHDGRLPAVDWGNWWVLRSDATRPGLQVVAYLGRGGAGVDRKPVSPRADAFLVLAAAVGLPRNVIGRMMKMDPKWVDYRLRALRQRGRLPWLIKAHQLPVKVDGAGNVWADWREHRDRFPRLARAMRYFKAGQTLAHAELTIVARVLYTWCRFGARSQTQRALAGGFLHMSRQTTEHVRRRYERMKVIGIDPLRYVRTA